MFRIDAQSNSIVPLTVRTFSELGFRERNHLQEWIAKSPSCLGEELLIIQTEFSGFSDTNVSWSPKVGQVAKRVSPPKPAMGQG